MLPGSFQMPAAVILFAGGLCSCFAGYRIFRFVLAFFGFVFGALFVGAAHGQRSDALDDRRPRFSAGWSEPSSCLAYFVGVALIGAGIGAGLAMVIWAALNREPGIWPVVILAVIGAIGALAVQRHVIIVATAFAGAQTAVVGGRRVDGVAQPGRRQPSRVSRVSTRSAAEHTRRFDRVCRPRTGGTRGATANVDARQEKIIRIVSSI